MSNDINFEEPKARSARRGRRAAAPAEQSDSAISIDTIATGSSQQDAPAPVPTSRPSRRVGGWGDEIGAESAETTDSRLGGPTKAHESDDEPDIPVLPDQDDGRETSRPEDVSMAPNVVVNRVATYRELDTDLLRHNQFLTLDNEIDLKLLAKCLVTESEVQEPDVAWDWDRLFTEVTSEMQIEAKDDEENTEASPSATKPTEGQKSMNINLGLSN